MEIRRSMLRALLRFEIRALVREIREKRQLFSNELDRRTLVFASESSQIHADALGPGLDVSVELLAKGPTSPREPVNFLHGESERVLKLYSIGWSSSS
jgi:hypothetical protein